MAPPWAADRRDRGALRQAEIECLWPVIKPETTKAE